MQDQSEINAIAVIEEEGPEENRELGYWVIIRAEDQPETEPPSSVLWKVEHFLDGAGLEWETAYDGDSPLKSPTNILHILIPVGKAIHHAIMWVAHHGGSDAVEEALAKTGVEIFKEGVKSKRSGRELDELLKAAKCAKSSAASLWNIDADSTGLTCTEIKSEKGTFYFMLRYGAPCALITVKKDGDSYSVQSREIGKMKKA